MCGGPAWGREGLEGLGGWPVGCGGCGMAPTPKGGMGPPIGRPPPAAKGGGGPYIAGRIPVTLPYAISYPEFLFTRKHVYNVT